MYKKTNTNTHIHTQRGGAEENHTDEHRTVVCKDSSCTRLTEDDVDDDDAGRTCYDSYDMVGIPATCDGRRYIQVL